MPFNGSGTFSIINTFVPNTTILSAAVNANFSDIATGLSDCLTRDGQAGMTAAFKAISGTVGAPSITFTSDATTGLYLISAGNLGLTASGVLQVTVSTAGIAVVNNAAISAVESALVNTVLNVAAVTTASNINTLATSGTGAVTVGSTTNWNTTGYLLCNKEIMQYTVASAAGITVNTRGQLGTTSVSHATNSSVTMLYTGVGFNDLLLPARATAGRPGTPVPGDFGYNTTLGQPEYWNGTTWISTANPQITPQGYLSPTSGTPIITGDATSQTSIFYNPFQGNLLPVPNAGVFALTTFTTAQIDLSAGSQAVNGIYDVYAFVCSTNSTLTFAFSPSWAAGTGGSVTAGSCARGTGAGGTQLTALNGLFTNTLSMTLNNGASSYSMATASGVYLGSVYVSPTTAGTLNLHRGYGQSRQWGIWNAFNRVPVYLKGGDGTASWTYATATIRPSNNATANNVTIFSGLAVNTYDLSFMQLCAVRGDLANSIGIGYNVTNAYTGLRGTCGIAGESVAAAQAISLPVARYQGPPALGINVITACESGNATGTNTFNGTETNMVLQAQWMA